MRADVQRAFYLDAVERGVADDVAFVVESQLLRRGDAVVQGTERKHLRRAEHAHQRMVSKVDFFECLVVPASQEVQTNLSLGNYNFVVWRRQFKHISIARLEHVS